MRWSMVVGAVVLGIGMEQQPQFKKKTDTWEKVTKETKELTDPAAMDSSVVNYLKAMQFHEPGKTVEMRPSCFHGCDTNTIKLELAAELRTVGLNKGDLGNGGRIVARIRHVDARPGKVHKDFGLRALNDEVYLWVAGKSVGNEVYKAAFVRIDKKTGKREKPIVGKLRYCPNPVNTPESPAGIALFTPPHDCKKPGQAVKGTYHLTAWFPCDQGCCVFSDT